MPIVPGTQPVKGLQRRSQPFQPLPVEQISATSQRLTERLQKVRGAHAKLMSQIASQNVLPQNQRAYELATQKVRQRLKDLSKDDRFYNKLPQVRREAQRFAQIAKGFKQNRKAIQETMKSLEEAEGLTDAQRAVLKQQIMKNAGVALTNEGTVDPSTISQSRKIQPGQDPREFLDKRLSQMEERTINKRASEDGVIKKSTQSVLSFDRLQRQGLKELGFKLENPNGEITRENLQKVASANPKVERWMDRQRAVFRRSIANKMRQKGKDPSKNQEEFRRKVDQALKDQIFNMVNTVASRHVSGDVTPEITIKDDPRVDENEKSSGGSDTGPFGGAVVNPGLTIADNQAKKIQEATRKKFLRKRFKKNDNISRDEYRKIDKQVGDIPTGGERIVSTGGIAVPARDRKSKLEKLKSKYGEATIEAYKKIKRGEQNIENSIGEFAIQQRAFDLTDKPKQRNQVERAIAGEDPKNLKSPQLTKDQITWLIKDSDNFQLMDVATDGSWFRIKPKEVKNMPGGENIFGMGKEKPTAGEPIVIRNVGKGVGEGTAQQDFIDAITKGLDQRARELIKQERKIGDQAFGTEWSKVKKEPDVKIKLQGLGSSGDFSMRKQPVTPRFVSKVGDQPVTFGRIGEKLVSKDISEEKLHEFASGMAQAANNLPMMKSLISNPRANVNPMTPGSMANALAKWFSDRESMGETEKEIMKKIMNAPIPASRPGQALQWAEQLKKLK